MLKRNAGCRLVSGIFVVSLVLSGAAFAGINTWTSLGPDVRVEALVIDREDPAVLYSGTELGIFRSADGGFSWSLLASRSVDELAQSPHDPRVFFAADRGRVWRSDDRGETWSGPLNPPVEAPAFLTLTGLAIDPLVPGKVIASGMRGRVFGAVPFVDVSLDGGATWTRDDGPGTFLGPLEIDPRQPDNIFVGGLGIYRSADGGQTWQESLRASVGEDEYREILTLAIAPSDPRIVYAGASEDALVPDRLWRSVDGGASWTVSSDQLDDYAILDLAVSPEDSEVVYAAVGHVFSSMPGRIYRSRDGAVTWELVGEELEVSAGVLVTHPLFPRTLYAGGQRITKLTESVAGGCAPGEALCLNGERFHVEAFWRDFQGRSGRGRAVRFTEDSGYLWFFDPGNVELVVKALDGRGFNDHFWVFYGSLSNVEFLVQVTDVQNERVRTYGNPPESFASVGDVTAFPALDRAASSTPRPRALGKLGKNGPCAVDPTTLCLGDRFALSMSWRDFEGRAGRGIARTLSDDSGYFWFFDSENVEVVVKVLDGTAINDHFWVFFGSLSNVEFTLEVEDLETGNLASYFNPLGTFASVGDTEALP